MITCEPNIACMQEAAAATMLDRCHVGRETPAADGEEDTGEWTYAEAETVCGINLGKPHEVRGPEIGAEATMVDGIARFPVGTDIRVTDRIKVDVKAGQALDTPFTLAIFGEPDQRATAIVCNVIRVVGASHA